MAKFDRLHITQKSILRKKILQVMHKRVRPMLIGEIAVDINEPLELVEELLGQMSDPNIDDRQIEEITQDDGSYETYSENAVLYRLIVKPSLHIAHGDDPTQKYGPLKSLPPKASE